MNAPSAPRTSAFDSDRMLPFFQTAISDRPHGPLSRRRNDSPSGRRVAHSGVGSSPMFLWFATWPASPSACALFLVRATAFCADRLRLEASGRKCVAGSDAPAIERATARSGGAASNATALAIPSARMAATSAAEALASQRSARPPVRCTRQPRVGPSVTAYPGQRKYIPDRLQAYRNWPPESGLWNRYRQARWDTRPCAPPVLADGVMVDPCFRDE